jgi:hypothetical protein
MEMNRIFKNGDLVKLKEELVNAITYNNIQPNKKWRNRIGVVQKAYDTGCVLVKWRHLSLPTHEMADYLEHVEDNDMMKQNKEGDEWYVSGKTNWDNSDGI